MEQKNKFEMCIIVRDLQEAAAGRCKDKDGLIASLTGVDITGKGEADNYRLLAALQKTDGEAFSILCKAILLYVAGSHTDDFNILNVASKELLEAKRQELARLEKEVERLEEIEKYKELKDLLGPDGKIGDEYLNREFETLDRIFNPDKYENDGE